MAAPESTLRRRLSATRSMRNCQRQFRAGAEGSDLSKRLHGTDRRRGRGTSLATIDARIPPNRPIERRRPLLAASLSRWRDCQPWRAHPRYPPGRMGTFRRQHGHFRRPRTRHRATPAGSCGFRRVVAPPLLLRAHRVCLQCGTAGHLGSRRPAQWGRSHLRPERIWAEFRPVADNSRSDAVEFAHLHAIGARNRK